MNLVILVAALFGIVISKISSINARIFSPFNGKSTLEWISVDPQFSGFYNLIRHNSEARDKFVEEEMTIFVPTNEALTNHQASIYADCGLYHMASTAKDVSELKKMTNLTSVNKNLPKLWITSSGDNIIYINNAKVVSTSYFSTSRSVENKVITQSLFMIDQLLDPMIRAPPRPHTAFDLLVSPEKWGSNDIIRSTSLFKFRLGEKKMEDLFSSEGGNTYFVPIDKEISPQKYNDINEYSIRGHIVPNSVLFTRPTPNNFFYETMANDESVYMVVSFVEIDNKKYVKSRTVFGTDEKPEGEYIAEILYSDIPVANGVVHLSSEPLGFNAMLTPKNKSLTLLVPNDFSWNQMKKHSLEYYDADVDILKRHLIISDTPLSLEKLYSLGRWSTEIKPVELATAAGIIKVFIHKKQSSTGEPTYYIQWYNKLIKVVRANYECSDGIIHVIAGPFATLHRTRYGEQTGCC